jgi:hypothetical protein
LRSSSIFVDRADAIARDGSDPDVIREARRIVRAHPEADQPVAHVVAALKQELANSGAVRD